MSRHLKSILIFGYLPSIVLFVALSVGVQVFRNGVERQKKIRQTDYKTFKANEEQITALESFLKTDQRRAKMAFLESHLDDDLLQTLSTNLAEILAGYKDSEIQNTAIGRPGGSSQIATQTESKFSRVNLVFEGHYSAIQKTVTELEFRMPLISLESLSVKPATQNGSSQESPKLKIELNYICWHRPEKS